ncbi:MAG: rRNA maturation RNase YbeY [Rhodobacteraceae bacterium]|nr:rRNA maturation RNase YbeY [Paracoccaceae bacterium]
MADLVDLVIEDARWEALDMDKLAEKAAGATLKIAGISSGYEICVMACDDARITELNGEFREKPTATNVLSWPAFDLSPDVEGGLPTAPPPAESLGDIAIAYETCAREAAEKGITMQAHVLHLIVHGCLHLLGYDHETDKDATLMEELEVKALASMGVDDPY